MAKTPTHPSVREITRFRFDHDALLKQRDQLTVEEPLEISISFQQTERATRERMALAVTMRTPGNDHELAAGFLFAEGLIKSKNDIHDIATDAEAANPDNTLIITLSHPLQIEPDRLQRYFFTNSSCGVCGKTSIQALEMMHQPSLIPGEPKISAKLLLQLPDKLQHAQEQFSTTGGVHATAAFSTEGKLLMLKEDVGRHNALDKLIGTFVLNDNLSLLKNAAVLVSGRSSFELVQKALMADIAILAAIGAPTSLAQQLADRHNMTLLGFLKSTGFNVYTGLQRIAN